MLDAVGAGGVSAQRVTQAADHVAQPLEMVAAPVALPEPAGVVGAMPGTSGFTTAIFKANEVPVGTHLYAEQQVRQLQAATAGCMSKAGWQSAMHARMAAPQPQADARDAERYRWLRAQPLESDVFCTTIWRKGSDGFGDDLRLEELDAAIDAAIAASKEKAK